ncbi:MAG: extracellular solute-binding protein [Phycisphaerales bacterium]|nr:extracellular solute-binding protein [Phycisphaerales bacterium]
MSDRAESTLHLTRRTALGALAAGAAGWALLPSRPRSHAGVPRGRTEITYWEKWTNREGEAIQAVVDRFNQTQSRIWVHRIPVADITSKAMVAIGGGDPPDLVGFFTYNVPQFAEAGAIMAMDEFDGLRDGLPPLDPDLYAPAVRRLLTYRGRQRVGVNTCYTLGLYWNRAHFRERGLDPDQPPTTLDRLDELGEALTALAQDGRIERAGFLQNMPGWWPTIWPIFFGADVYDAEADTCTIAGDACIRAYEWVQATARRFGPEQTRSFMAQFGRSNHSAQDPFISGRASMIMQGPWMANFINAFNPGLDYGAAVFPMADELAGAGVLPGLLEADVLAIPRACPHPEEAWTFFKHMQSVGVQEALARAHCKPSPMRTTSPGFAVGHGNPFVGAFDAIAKSPDVKVLPQTRVWKQFSDLSISAFDAIWSGADVPTELAALQSRVNDQIATDAARRARRSRA